MRGETLNDEISSADWLAPWFTIWISPRATIRRIVDADPNRFVLGIAWVAGALAALNIQLSAQGMPGGGRFFTDSLGSMGALGLGAFAFALGLGGIAMLYLFGALYRWSGGALGGTARTVEVRSALAWAQIPAIYVTIIGVIAAVVRPAQPGQLLTLSLWSLVRMALDVWAFFIPVETLAEVHHFSAWRSAATMLLGDLAVGLVGVAIAVAFLVARHAG